MTTSRELVLNVLTKAYLNAEGIDTVDLFDDTIAGDIKDEIEVDVKSASFSAIETAKYKVLDKARYAMEDVIKDVKSIDSQVDEGEINSEILSVVASSKLLTLSHGEGTKLVDIVISTNSVSDALKRIS